MNIFNLGSTNFPFIHQLPVRFQPIKHIMILNPVLRWIPVLTFNELLHLIISCQPTFILCHKLFQDIHVAQRFIRPVLHLQDHRAGLQRPHRMPLTDGNTEGDHRAGRAQFDGLRTTPFPLVVELLHQPPAQTDHRLRRFPVPMHRHLAPRATW